MKLNQFTVTYQNYTNFPKIEIFFPMSDKGYILVWFVPNRLYLETLTYAHMDDLAHSLLARIRCFTTQRIIFFINISYHHNAWVTVSLLNVEQATDCPDWQEEQEPECKMQEKSQL